MKKTEEAKKSDWDNEEEEDNWDDWGDAEENFPDSESTVAAAPTATTATTQKASDMQNSNINNNETNDSNHNQRSANVPNQTPQENKSWGSMWKPWGGVVSSVLSTATEGLGNITSTVSQGLTNVIGVPDPEDLARINAEEEAKKQSQAKKTDEPEVTESTDKSDQGQEQPAAQVFGLSLVSGVTTLGSKVLNTGLDTLEGIGKKTMNILQENDPLLKNKRKMLGLDPERPNLSEILKEAKKESDQLENTLKELKLEKSKEMLRFEILFENNCGLVHLEALEILSKESTIKLKSLQSSVSGNALTELQETLNEVKELIDLEDLEGESDGDYDANELSEKLLAAVEDADLKINFDDITKIWSDALDWINTSSAESDVQETFAKGITTLSETCAFEINKLHKIAELLLVKEHHSTANEVDSIVQLCKHFTMHLNGVANRFAATLSAKNSDDGKTHINTLFAEMVLAMKEIDKAFKLFLPILQIGAV